jgi:hypothetical protein
VASGRAGIVLLLTSDWSRPGQDVAEGGRRGMDKAGSQKSQDTMVVVLCLEGGVDGGTVPGMACTVAGFHRPSRDGQ